MRTIGNIIWLIIAGWAIALAFAVAGVIMFVFIVTIPWGIASFRLANYALWPFGRTSVPNPDAGVCDRRPCNPRQVALTRRRGGSRRSKPSSAHVSGAASS